MQSKDGVNFLEYGVTIHYDEAAVQIYYFIGIIETKKVYFRVASYSAAAHKGKLKHDFQGILLKNSW
jgi:hypothetical protein